MRTLRAVGAVSGIALAALLVSPAAAQIHTEEEEEGRVYIVPEKPIVVTGSLIAGSREDAPAPVDVIDAE